MSRCPCWNIIGARKKSLHCREELFLCKWPDVYIYWQTCVKRSPLGQRKGGLIRQVTSYKRLNSYEIFYDRTRQMWAFNTGDCLIEVTACLPVYEKWYFYVGNLSYSFCKWIWNIVIWNMSFSIPDKINPF